MSGRILKSVIRQGAPASFEVAAMLDNAVQKMEIQAREVIRRLVHEIFEEEVQALAGVRYQRGRKTEILRAGSDPGSVKASGQRLAVRKPRLKQAGQEVQLESYRRLQNWDVLTPRIIEYMLRGVSTRDYDPLLEEISGGLGLSKSSVSRAFIRGSRQALEDLQTRSLTERTWTAILIDGIHFAGRNVTVAVGITAIGEKVVLGLREGNTESAAVCIDLLQNLIERGLSADRPVLFVIDGGKGLRRAIRDVFGESALVQRCWIHKARNIEEYIPERALDEFRRRFKRVRTMERYSDAQQELATLRQWLYRVAPSAAQSLDEAGEELLSAQRLGAGRVLRRALTSTNTIENIFSQVRYRCLRVKKWNSEQIQRWVATSLIYAEKRCNRISGYFDCEAFAAKLEKQGLRNTTKAA
jgi:putative transposase